MRTALNDLTNIYNLNIYQVSSINKFNNNYYIMTKPIEVPQDLSTTIILSKGFNLIETDKITFNFSINVTLVELTIKHFSYAKSIQIINEVYLIC